MFFRASLTKKLANFCAALIALYDLLAFVLHSNGFFYAWNCVRYIGYFFPYKTDMNSTPLFVLEVAIILNISTQEGYLLRVSGLIDQLCQKKKMPFPVVASLN